MGGTRMYDDETDLALRGAKSHAWRHYFLQTIRQDKKATSPIPACHLFSRDVHINIDFSLSLLVLYTSLSDATGKGIILLATDRRLDKYNQV